MRLPTQAMTVVCMGGYGCPKQKLVADTLASGGAVVPRGTGGSAGSWSECVAAADEWERQHEAEWVRIDQKLRGIAARRAALDAEEARLLRYAEELKLWRGWGFGSMLEYLERAMGYAPHTAKRAAARRAGARRAAADRGSAGARRACALGRPRAVARRGAGHRGGLARSDAGQVSARDRGHGLRATGPEICRTIRPSHACIARTITLELSPESYDLWRKLHALAAEEHGQRLSDDELIPALFRRAYGDGALDSRSERARIPMLRCAAAPEAARPGRQRRCGTRQRRRQDRCRIRGDGRRRYSAR